MSEALRRGVSRKALYAMRDRGSLEQLSRGVWRLTEMPGLEHPDLVAVAKRVPTGVVCLISALAFHDLTTQIPHAVDIAIRRGGSRPRIDYPPVNVYRFGARSFEFGITTPVSDGQPIRVYSAEKTIADVWKYRNKIGMDVALESLRAWRERRGSSVSRLLESARVCRVAGVMRPYLEAMV